jgi:hypothetical protein
VSLIERYECLPWLTFVDPSNGGSKQSRKVGVNKNVIICQNEEEYYLKSAVAP